MFKVEAELAVCQRCVLGRHRCCIDGQEGQVGSTEPGKVLEPTHLYKCRHAECSNFVRPENLKDANGVVPKSLEQIICPSHNCFKCDKPIKAGQKVARCLRCPKVFHFDARAENIKFAEKIN